MRQKNPPNYLAGYPLTLTGKVKELIEQGELAQRLMQRYPAAHNVRTDRALYEYVEKIKDRYLRNAGNLSRVAYDSSLQVMRNALGVHISRGQGANLKNRREILVAGVFRNAPPEFLRMIVVHEVAHFREREHNKSFYQLCLHMEPEYHRLEFDLRAYLTYLAAQGAPLWLSVRPDAG